jgi:hypothetical protein
MTGMAIGGSAAEVGLVGVALSVMRLQPTRMATATPAADRDG